MWTTLGLVGLVLMLMASEATNSQNLQMRTSHTSRRGEYNNTQMLLKVNIGRLIYTSSTLLPISESVLDKKYSKTFQNLVSLCSIYENPSFSVFYFL